MFLLSGHQHEVRGGVSEVPQLPQPRGAGQGGPGVCVSPASVRLQVSIIIRIRTNISDNDDNDNDNVPQEGDPGLQAGGSVRGAERAVPLQQRPLPQPHPRHGLCIRPGR